MLRYVLVIPPLERYGVLLDVRRGGLLLSSCTSIRPLPADAIACDQPEGFNAIAAYCGVDLDKINDKQFFPVDTLQAGICTVAEYVKAGGTMWDCICEGRA